MYQVFRVEAAGPIVRLLLKDSSGKPFAELVVTEERFRACLPERLLALFADNGCAVTSPAGPEGRRRPLRLSERVRLRLE